MKKLWHFIRLPKMRESLTPFKGANRLNYICILASELLGVGSLRSIPALLSGFDSVSQTLHPDVAAAINTLRVCGFAPTTHRELRLNVDAYLNHHRKRDSIKEEDRDGFEQFYDIERDFTIVRRWSSITPESVAAAIQTLINQVPVMHVSPLEFHNPDLSASIRSKSHDFRGDIERLEVTPAKVPAYDISRVGCAPGLVSWKELIDIANKFDEIDVAHGRQQLNERSWFYRIHDKDGNPTAILMEYSTNGLTKAQGLELSGIKHLIGLPGAGKTTILYLLAAWMSERGLRACFLFPSIEVSSAFIELLERYNIRAGLLSGQSESSRARHVSNFSTSLAKENNGYAISKSTYKFFATNCALGGFASEEDMAFPHSNPPCMDLQQRLSTESKPQARRCALAGSCGRQQSERELIEANIWAGHVLSLDRDVSLLFSDFKVKHFEFIARTFDLVVVDECDGAQADLDDRGTPIMKLFGDEDALWATLIGDLHAPIAKGRNAFVSGKDMPSLIEMTGRFGQATNRLSAWIQHLSEPIQKTYQSKLLTSLSIIADMFPYGGELGDDEEIDSHFRARSAVEQLWDASVKPVAFRPSIQDDEEEEGEWSKDFPEIALHLGLSVTEVEHIYKSLREAISKWDIDADYQAIEKIAHVLRDIPTVDAATDTINFVECCGLLTNVSLVVLQHFGLAPHLRLLNSLNLVSDNVFESRPSRDQLGILPESLTGKLSGIRFTLSDEGNINITHIGFQGTPRRLFQRMQTIGKSQGAGSAFLLTSATSLLEQSPRFHVNVGPHYVLRRPNAGDGWKNSRYEFTPLNDPQQTGKYLRFSGSKLSHRERILKSMSDGLLDNGSLSKVASAISTNDVVNGTGRKVGFVVNSYDQCELLYNHIQQTKTDYRGKVRYLRRSGSDRHSAHAVSAADVENLGFDNSWEILIFPMNAIGRGVNIVYKQGPRTDKAMIGSLYFLTRPHPRQDDLGLIQGLVARRSEEFDTQIFADTISALSALSLERKAAVEEAKAMLRMPLIASRMGSYAKPFVADQMIIILQTIGRAMRGDCPAFVYFVDAAWAPNSAAGNKDTDKTSMLCMMQTILQECLNHPDPTLRECYSNLYTSFARPLSQILNLSK